MEICRNGQKLWHNFAGSGPYAKLYAWSYVIDHRDHRIISLLSSWKTSSFYYLDVL